MNILMLTSEFLPATGGIGTYAREMASAASALGARVTVVAPDYARQTEDDDRMFSFPTRPLSRRLHSARDLPAKIMLARNAVSGGAYDILHAADWPFFIPVALSRRRTPARVIMTLHGSEINETQTFLKRLAIGGAGVFGAADRDRRQQPFYRDLFRRRFGVDTAQDQRHSARRVGILVRRATETAREVRAAYGWRGPDRADHGRAAHPPQGAHLTGRRVAAADELRDA